MITCDVFIFYLEQSMQSQLYVMEEIIAPVN